MKNVFDAHNNYDEWEENDWEFEEYTEIHEQEKDQPAGKHYWIWYLVVIAVISILCFVIGNWLK